MRRLTELILRKKGETLIEGLASLLLFAILFAGVVMMVQASFRVSGTGIDGVNQNQENLNRAILADYDMADSEVTANNIKITVVEDGVNLDDIPVLVFMDEIGVYLAFRPIL
jgi:hypothetical protein